MTRDDLKAMQAWSLERKIQVSQARLIEFYQHFGGRVSVSFSGGKPHSMPLSFWTEQDVLRYIQRTGLEFASVYGEIAEGKNGRLTTTGEARTGCIFCPVGCHLDRENKFQRLARTHPKMHRYCMEDLGLRDFLDCIGVEGGDAP